MAGSRLCWGAPPSFLNEDDEEEEVEEEEEERSEVHGNSLFDVHGMQALACRHCRASPLSSLRS